MKENTASPLPADLAARPLSLWEIVKENKVWFLCMFVFLLVGAYFLMRIQTGDFILYFSENRTPFGEFFFTWFTKVGEEPTYLALVFIFLFIRFRYAALVGATGIVTMIVSFGSKAFFGHDRPILFFEKLGNLDTVNLIDGVHTVTGQTSFPSGHTMSGFALFGILAFLLKEKNFLNFVCFIIALLIGISRIYLVQHFLKDIYVGATMGVVIALLLYWFQSKFPKNEKNLIDRRIRFKKRA